MVKEGTVLSKVLRRLRPYWAMLAGTTFLAGVNVAIGLYIPILVGQAIDHMAGPDAVDMAAVVRKLVAVLFCVGISGVARWIMTELSQRVAYRVTRDIRDEAFDHIQRLPLSYLDRHPHGDLVSRVVSDVDTFGDGLLMGFAQLFTGIMTILGALALMLAIRWQIALVVVVLTPLSLVVAKFISDRTYSMFRLQTQTKGEQTAMVNETLAQLKVVKAFGHEAESMERFRQVNDRLEHHSLRATFFSSLVNPSTRAVYSLVYAGVALTGALMVMGGGGFTVGNLTSFLNYANQYTKPFNEISGVIAELQNSLACIGRVFELLEEPAMEPDPPALPMDRVEGQVQIRDLRFSYRKDRPLIQGFDLSVEPGQRVAIVGPTGCGKTTLLNLLMRFYDPDDGRILLDGADTRQMPRGQLRRCVGMVLQDTWLCDGTIRDNIIFGKPDATDDEVVAAAMQAHAHSFIKRLPKGYDTVVGSAGVELSQGQKQLLCIARVMLCLPPMLFLDEATSSIDTRTEMKIQKAFGTMMEGRTTFIVAHRLSTIREADIILVMRSGQIVEQGSHEELLKKRGSYVQLYNSQFAH